MASANASKMRVAILGLGRLGSLYLNHLTHHPLAEIAAVIEPLSENLNYAKKHFGDIIPVAGNVEEQTQSVFKDQKIDAVIITTPTDTHENLVKQALHHGKNVFCETPISLNRNRLRKCFELSEQVAKTLHSGFQRRFDYCFGDAYQKVRFGGVGHIHMIKSTSRDSEMPSDNHLRQSGGIFHDLTVSDIDMLMWVAGEKPKTVYAAAHANSSTISQNQDYDTVSVTLKFPSGIIGIVDQSRNVSYGFDQRLEILGEKGMIQVNNIPQCFTSLHTNDGSHAAKLICPPTDRFNTAYKREMDHFLNVLQGKEPHKITADSVIAAETVANACLESAMTDSVINLEWD